MLSALEEGEGTEEVMLNPLSWALQALTFCALFSITWVPLSSGLWLKEVNGKDFRMSEEGSRMKAGYLLHLPPCLWIWQWLNSPHLHPNSPLFHSHSSDTPVTLHLPTTPYCRPQAPTMSCWFYSHHPFHQQNPMNDTKISYQGWYMLHVIQRMKTIFVEISAEHHNSRLHYQVKQS
jgi:hypothetical protein